METDKPMLLNTLQKLLFGYYMNYCLWTVMSEQNLQSCLKLRNSQNPFCYILETLNKNSIPHTKNQLSTLKNKKVGKTV